MLDRASGAPLSEAVTRVGPEYGDKMRLLIVLLDSETSTNILYSGFGATMSPSREPQAREVAVHPNSTGMRLTAQNSQKVSLGIVTRQDVEALLGTELTEAK